MHKIFVIAGVWLVASQAHAQDPCQLATRTVTNGSSTITQSVTLGRTVVNLENGWRSCRVHLQAQHNGQPRSAWGEHTWGDGKPIEEGCAIAKERARVAIHEQIGSVHVSNTQVLSCNDPKEPASSDSAKEILSKYALWYTAPLFEFPIYNPRRPFSHRSYPGSTCLQFRNDLNQIGGTVCMIRDGRWTVVDIVSINRVK